MSSEFTFNYDREPFGCDAELPRSRLRPKPWAEIASLTLITTPKLPYLKKHSPNTVNKTLIESLRSSGLTWRGGGAGYSLHLSFYFLSMS